MQETYTELLTQMVADLHKARNRQELQVEGTPPTDELHRLWFIYTNKLKIHTNQRDR